MTQLFLFPDSESKISAYEKGLSDIPALGSVDIWSDNKIIQIIAKI